MKRLLPLLIIAFIGLIALILSDGPSQGPNENNLDPSIERPVLEAAGPLSNNEERIAIEEEAWTDPRGIKTGVGNYPLSGIVVDENQEPLSDMWVAAYSSPYPFIDYELDLSEALINPLNLTLEPLASTRTNESGEFSLEGLPGQVIYVVARGKKYLTKGRQEVRTASFSGEEPVVIQTIPGAELRGQVAHANGSPAANAEVIVMPNLLYAIQAIRTGNIFFERTFSDSSGNFYLDAVPSRTRLSVLTIGAPTEPGFKDIGPYPRMGSQSERFQLFKTGKLAGKVVYEDGSPASSAEVLAIPIDLRLMPAVIRNIPGWFSITNSKGEYEFNELPNRGYVLFAQNKDGRAAPISSTLSGNFAQVNQDLVIKDKEKIQGRLVDASGKPLAGARVLLNSIPDLAKEEGGRRGAIPSASSMLMEVAKEALPELLPKDIFVNTNANGEFTVNAWERASLVVVASGYPTATFDLPSLDLENGKDSFLLTMMQPGSIKGKVITQEDGQKVEFFLARGEMGRHLLSPTDGELEYQWNDEESWRENEQRRSKALREKRAEQFGEIIQENEILVTPEQSILDAMSAASIKHSPDGTFQLKNIMPGDWSVEVVANGFVTSEKSVLVEPLKETTINFEMSRGATLSGQVVAAGTREPVPGAIISMGSRKASGFEALWQNGFTGSNVVMSDKQGNFTLRGIKPGMEWLAVSAEGFSDTTIKGRPLEESEVRTDVVIQVRQGSTVQGFVYDRNNQPLPQRMVGGFSTDSEDFWQTTTDEKGFYQAENIKPGNYFVASAALNAGALMQGDFLSILNGGRVLSVFAKEGETVDLDIIDLSAGGCNFKGRLTDLGKPLPNVALFCMASDGGSMFDLRMASAQTNERGEFEFASLAPGKYNLQFRSPDLDGTLTFEVPDAPEDYQELETPQGVVRGQIVSAESGIPLKDITVRLEREDGPSGMMGMFMGRSSLMERTDENGYYEISGVTPGEYHITAEQGWWGRRNRENSLGSVGKEKSDSFTLSMNDNYQVETLSLPAASAIKVTISTADGEGYERGFQIQAVEINTKEKQESWGWSGEGRMEGLQPGTYDITIQPRNKYATYTISGVNVIEGQTIELEAILEAGSRLQARVLDSGSQNVQAKLRVFDSGGKRVDSDGGGRFWSSLENGTTPLGSYKAGTYRIEAEYDGRKQSKTVTLRDGENETVEFVF